MFVSSCEIIFVVFLLKVLVLFWRLLLLQIIIQKYYICHRYHCVSSVSILKNNIFGDIIFD